MRRGFTIIELAVGASILALLMAFIYGIWAQASRSTGKSVAHSEALRSVLVASEAIRRDACRIFYKSPLGSPEPTADLNIWKGGTHIGLHIPGAENPGDIWNLALDPVEYYLKEIGSRRYAFQLWRKDKTGERQIRAVVLGGLHFEVHEPGSISPLQGYLQVTMVGLDSEKSKASFTASMLIPLTVQKRPASYRVNPGGIRL